MTETDNGRRLRQLLYAMVLLLTFEGIARKASPSELRVPLFLLKDVLVLIMAFYVVRMPLSPVLKTLRAGYITLIVFIVPNILMTAWYDPLLAVFGAKEYLLYPIVGFATFLAFENARVETALTFFRWMALLIIPTALLAFVQSRLPSDNWINMSVNGESMKGFSADGELRVSSTFSFVAQYSAFLNAEIFIISLALYKWGTQKSIWKIILPTLVPLIVLSCFITGSRSAVVVNTVIVVLAAGLVMMKFQVRNVFQIVFFILALYLAVLAVHYLSPRSMAAYAAREDGQLLGFSMEIRNRVFDSYFNLVQDKSLHTLMGNGIGIMSNGSDSFSSYAAFWRGRLWTESDFSTTLFEGGYYLVFVWYAFRLFVILLAFGNFLAYITSEYSVPLAFCQAFVIVVGLFGTLALQPPVAIWWWMGVGTVLLFAWKCTEPPEAEQKREKDEWETQLPRPKRKIRGRSLYADVIHRRK